MFVGIQLLPYGDSVTHEIVLSVQNVTKTKTVFISDM